VSTNKDKIRASAQKYLQKGQVDKAIKEFERLVEEDPKDVRTLLKIGDLQTRIGEHAAATHTYGRVAQFYSEQGFFLKAVAVYKQILKIDPTLVDVNLKLAELYHQLGLMSDASQQYRQISQIYESLGRTDDSIAILRKKSELEQFYVPDDVILFVASMVKSNIRLLEGSLIRLKAFASMTGSGLTVDDAKDILKDALPHDVSSPVQIETIQRLVAHKYSLDVKDLKGQQRTQQIALPRQLAMHLASVMTDLSSTDIGRAFGGRDHTTVLHARKKIQKMLDEDPFFLELVNKLQADIKSVGN